jgi:hypothetical protein
MKTEEDSNDEIGMCAARIGVRNGGGCADPRPDWYGSNDAGVGGFLGIGEKLDTTDPAPAPIASKEPEKGKRYFGLYLLVGGRKPYTIWNPIYCKDSWRDYPLP